MRDFERQLATLSPFKRQLVPPSLAVAPVDGLAYIATMADDPENPTLDFLRRPDSKMDGLAEDMRDMKNRLASVEKRLAGVERSVAMVHGDFAGQSRRIDRLEARLERIEQRLALRDA